MPSHRFSPIRIIRAFGCVVALAILVILALNLVDYGRFQRAWHVGGRLTPAHFRQIAMAVAEKQRDLPDHLVGAEIPSALQRLNALEATFGEGSANLLLFKSGDVKVWMRVERWKTRQEISLFTDAFGHSQTTLLWSNRPLDDPRDEKRRLLTISISDIHQIHEWIVLPDKIVVLGHDNTARALEPTMTVLPLAEANRRQIISSASAIPRAVRGRLWYDPNVIDGLEMDVSFSSDGRRQREDIALINRWKTEVAPLIDAILQAVPREYATDLASFKAEVTGYGGSDEASLSWPEKDANEQRSMSLPWWCVWPSLVRIGDS